MASRLPIGALFALLASAPALAEEPRGMAPPASGRYEPPRYPFNLRANAPLIVSLMFGRVFGDFQCDEQCGVLLALEPGVAGGKLSLGFSKGRGGEADLTVRTAKITLLRTWGRPWLADEASTYLGGELTTTLWRPKLVVAHLGALRRTGAPRASRNWIVTFGIGFGV